MTFNSNSDMRSLNTKKFINNLHKNYKGLSVTQKREVRRIPEYQLFYIK